VEEEAESLDPDFVEFKNIVPWLPNENHLDSRERETELEIKICHEVFVVIVNDVLRNFVVFSRSDQPVDGT